MYNIKLNIVGITYIDDNIKILGIDVKENHPVKFWEHEKNWIYTNNRTSGVNSDLVKLFYCVGNMYKCYFTLQHLI